MNLAELRAMKEKTDSIVATLQNDRKVLKEAKEKIIADNSKSFDEFLQSLCEYVALLSKDIYVREPINWLYEGFRDRHGYHAFYSDDVYVGISKDSSRQKMHMYFLMSGSEEGYSIEVFDDKAVFIKHEHRYNYMENELKKFILDNKENMRRAVEKIVEHYFDKLAEESKKENDKIYSDIEKLNRE